MEKRFCHLNELKAVFFANSYVSESKYIIYLSIASIKRVVLSI